MPSNIYQCPKCSNHSKYNESENFYFGLRKKDLYTDDNFIVNQKLFLRCPYCYEILDKSKTIKDSAGHQIIRKKKKGESVHIQDTTRAKCIELNLMEYHELLFSKKLSKEQKINIRVQILVLENNKRREWHNEKYEVPYNDNEINNFITLEKLLDLESGEFLVIELKRYLGKFDEARIQLDLLHDKLDYKAKYFHDKFNKEKLLIEYQNRYVGSFFLTEKAKYALSRIRY